MRWRVQYTRFTLVHLILNKKIPDVNITLASYARVTPIHFHIHVNLVVLEKLVGLVQVPLVMHKHNIPYIIWHINTCAN